jgi:hypothetical protein
MVIHSINGEEEIDPEVELLNLACLDLVGQIEELKKENARLKELIKQVNGPEVRSGPSVKS